MGLGSSPGARSGYKSLEGPGCDGARVERSEGEDGFESTMGHTEGSG